MYHTSLKFKGGKGKEKRLHKERQCTNLGDTKKVTIKHLTTKAKPTPYGSAPLYGKRKKIFILVGNIATDFSATQSFLHTAEHKTGKYTSQQYTHKKSDISSIFNLATTRPLLVLRFKTRPFSTDNSPPRHIF